jgi:hypothetical protein
MMPRGVPHLVSVELSVVEALTACAVLSAVVARSAAAVAVTPAATNDLLAARSQSVRVAHTTQISLSGLTRVVQKTLSASAAR